MHLDPLQRLDADLLLTLDALLSESNVTRAAQRLGVRQSAMSARLARLREIFDDRLFVASPDGRGVLATPRALALQPALTRVIELMEGMLGPAADFDPATARRTFTLALHEIPAMMLAPDLVPRIATAAPSARLVLVAPPEPQTLADRLEGGEVDICIGNRATAQSAWQARTLFEDRFLTAQRKGHPRGCAPLDLEAFCDAEHLLVSADGGGFFGHVDAALATLGRERRVALSIQNYALAPTIVGASDYLCTLPSRFLSRFENTLDFFEPPLELGAAELAAYWHPRFQDDPAHRWLREQLFAAASSTGRR
ncbi:LysR family transcriptional regulator [Bradyrhizobium sp. UFLA05-112]